MAEGAGHAEVQVVGGERRRFSERFQCTGCGRTFLEPQPRLFSFNNPYGACPTCHGFGNLIEVDLDLVVPDKSKSLAEGAIEPWSKPHYRGLQDDLRRFARRRGIPWSEPWSALDETQRRLVLEGDDDFPGILGFFRWLEGKKYKVQVRVFLSRYRGYQGCPACRGARLREDALRVRVGGLRIDEVSALSVREARAFLADLVLSEPERAVAGRVLGEVTRRLSYLSEVGLEYLTLDRPSGTLSGGESQRIALATALGAGLVGTLYVLDEPSVGLHPRDTDRLIRILEALRDQGNTVLVVEHDSAIMRAADYVIDLGPGAGEQGGRVVFQGTYPALLDDARSLTGKYLRGDLRIGVPPQRRRGNGLALRVRGARLHNLKGLDVRIPLGAFTAVTGVSGSGKSTLVHDVVCAGLARRAVKGELPGGGVLEGAEFVEEVEVVDQSPIGRSPRSNPVTYLKAFDGIRELFAATPDAKSRGLPSSHFSFNVPGGRCEACGGDGQVRVDMQFLADVSLVCEACSGRRYRPPVLEVRYRGRTIDRVLDLTVHEALQFFAGQVQVTRRLKVLEQIGLGYLRLGQSATTLSGGEAQR
ncbi:MAG TPA: excinuclease ABC subunit UvrA, partial [Vicinamibacteria bacterium]